MVPNGRSKALQCCWLRVAGKAPASTQSHAMSSTSPFLGAACAAISVSALSLTAFGLRQRRYDGWRLWVSALWVTTGGAALAVAAPGPWVEAAARLLLLQWPVLTLVGLRRFHPRQALPGHELHDWAVLAAAALATALSAAAAMPATAQGLALAAALAVHLYVATLLFMGPGGREFAPVQGLAAAPAGPRCRVAAWA
jgi:diguanylate cyclase